jgi:hypothetical protein
VRDALREVEGVVSPEMSAAELRVAVERLDVERLVTTLLRDLLGDLRSPIPPGKLTS